MKDIRGYILERVGRIAKQVATPFLDDIIRVAMTKTKDPELKKKLRKEMKRLRRG